MKITPDQYPGLTQNIATLGSVDLSDNDLRTLTHLAFILAAALENVATAIAAYDTTQKAKDDPPF